MTSGIQTTRYTAITIKRKKPFFDWINKLDSADIKESNNVMDDDILLLPTFDNQQQMMTFVRDNCAEIFAFQLMEYCMTDELWPDIEDFHIFQEWFMVSCHTMVHDWS